jgi:HEAT repeat protein/tRNA A-37 threonylcarbamoyl transferase component Bud32
MGLFTSMRADRLLATVREASDPGRPEIRAALAKLTNLGPSVVPLVMAELARSEKKATLAFVDVLAQLADARTFPEYVKGLSDTNPRVVAGVTWALSGARNLPPASILGLLQFPDLPRTQVMEIINAHRTRLTVRDLLQAAYLQEGTDRSALFRIIGEVMDATALPDLLARIDGKDPVARLNIIQLVARFDDPLVRTALQNQLRDPNRLIRASALTALSQLAGPVDVGAIARLLRDTDMEVQNRAVEVLIRARNPEVVPHLVEVLKDENEYARRAAVEVLNEVGDAGSVKFLLDAIKDADWWVRSRAADALAKIGGPRVLQAVLQLVRDPDGDVRRAAIEILNQTKDTRAVDSLIEATRDSDWWVSERAADALAEIGNRKAVPRLLEMLREEPRSIPTALRGLGKLGDPQALAAVVEHFQHPDAAIRAEAVTAAVRLADDSNAEAVRQTIRQLAVETSDVALHNAALAALEAIEARFSPSMVVAGQQARRLQEPAHTLLDDITGQVPLPGTPQRSPASLSTTAVGQLVIPGVGSSSSTAAGTLAGTFSGTLGSTQGTSGGSLNPQPPMPAGTQRLDISVLQPGEVIEGRYKYVEKIGKGAFGTVLLMEDIVVDERLVLKFLNANVAQDEEVLKRFVHELRYSRKITHRNVIRIYDFIALQGLYAISMEYFPSHTLSMELREDKPLALHRALQFGIDIASGMAVAHQVGIIHRDLKPANVLINDEDLLKIVDFGVAAAQRDTDTALTKTGYVIGSPKYMAPEQILGKKVDPRSDVYSLGVILYEMLTGVPPYSRGDHMSVMYQHVQGKARPPAELNPDLPTGLTELVMQAMAVDKTQRFQTMEELRLALTSFLPGA